MKMQHLAVISCFIMGAGAFLTAMILIGANMSDSGLVEEKTMSWKTIILPWLGALTDDNTSGIVYAYVESIDAVHNHNLTNDSTDTGCYITTAGNKQAYYGNLSATQNNTTIIDIPSAPTAHGFSVLVRWTVKEAWDYTTHAWDLTKVQAFLNCSDTDLDPDLTLGVTGPGTAAAEIQTAIGYKSGYQQYLFVFYVVNNSGSGYTFPPGGTISNIKWEFQYYG